VIAFATYLVCVLRSSSPTDRCQWLLNLDWVNRIIRISGSSDPALDEGRYYITFCCSKLDGQQIEQVREFRYLGSLISEDGYCEKEIASRIGMAKKVFHYKRKLFTGKMNLELKKRIVKCLVWSVATYTAETWTLREADRMKIEAFEMWIWRLLEKISWRD